MNKRTQADKTVSEELEKMQSFSIHKEQANWKLKFKCNTTYISTSQKILSTNKYEVNNKTMLKEIKKDKKK